MTLDSEQRARALRAKLAALVDQLSGTRPDPADLGPGAAAIQAGHAWVLSEHGGPVALSAALLWAQRNHADALTVFADHGADELARLAQPFRVGGSAPHVRGVQGASSAPASVAALEPSPDAPSGAGQLIELLRAAGTEVVVEHGVVRAEILGLEVARLVRWPESQGGDGELHLEAGVGRFDRDAVAAAHPDEAPTAALERAVAMVRMHRYPGAPVHPIQLLARERWLRCDAVADPTAIGATELAPIQMTTEASGLKDPHPAAALGPDRSGDAMLAVFSRGVDLAVVPLAADTRATHAGDASLVIATPPQDQHGATRTLAGMLAQPASLVSMIPGWG